MKKLAQVWQVATDEQGHSVIRTWCEPGQPRFKVEVVDEHGSARELVAEFGTRREAKKLAAWFGEHGGLRADVTLIARK